MLRYFFPSYVLILLGKNVNVINKLCSKNAEIKNKGVMIILISYISDFRKKKKKKKPLGMCFNDPCAFIFDFLRCF